jgi:OmpA-OmpF porin, OOP family
MLVGYMVPHNTKHMKKPLSLLLILLCALFGKAQDTQWAFRLLNCSSEKMQLEYSAINILGNPTNDVNKKSWRPKGIRKQEFIKVGFLTQVIAKQVIISGIFDPSNIQSVSVFDAAGKEYPIACDPKKEINPGYKHLYIPLKEEDLYIIAVKVILRNTTHSPTSLQAIGISTSTEIPHNVVKTSPIIDSQSAISQVGKTINTPFKEFGPMLSPDGKTLYFSRKCHAANIGGTKDEEDIWYAEWNEEENKWSEAKNFGRPLNNAGPNFINSFSQNGNAILLGNSYQCNGKQSGGISLSYRTENGWSFPKRLVVEDELNVSPHANYFLSNDQTTLLMSIERPGETKGDRDLYVSFPKNDSTWSKPQNLGPMLNTIGTEAAPFLSRDGHLLFFSSNGFNGYGGSDIYVSERLDDTWANWSVPENLGPMVNTPNDESFFSISSLGTQMFYTSTGIQKTDVDIYKIDLPPIAVFTH